MTIPHSDSTTQPPSSPTAPDETTRPPAILVLTAANDAEPGPACCPTCGRPYFGPAASQLLDLVILTHEQLGHIKAVLEEVVIP